MLKKFAVFSLTLCIACTLNAAPAWPKTLPEAINQNFEEIAKEPGAVIFIPPKGWKMAATDRLPPHVKVMVVGKGIRDFPPSINLSTEEFTGSLEDYLTIVKEINGSQGSDWKNLGKIRTQAGDANLSQAEIRTEWGHVRMMHVILKRNEMIYILTAASLKEEFPKFYKAFFESFKSLQINRDPKEMATRDCEHVSPLG